MTEIFLVLYLYLPSLIFNLLLEYFSMKTIIEILILEYLLTIKQSLNISGCDYEYALATGLTGAMTIAATANVH